jgi:cyanate permease
MGVQAALIAAGRAAVPALTGALHDLTGGYAMAMAMLTALLVAAGVLVAWSPRGAA